MCTLLRFFSMLDIHPLYQFQFLKNFNTHTLILCLFVSTKRSLPSALQIPPLPTPEFNSNTSSQCALIVWSINTRPSAITSIQSILRHLQPFERLRPLPKRIVRQTCSGVSITTEVDLHRRRRPLENCRFTVMANHCKPSLASLTHQPQRPCGRHSQESLT